MASYFPVLPDYQNKSLTTFANKFLGNTKKAARSHLPGSASIESKSLQLDIPVLSSAQLFHRFSYNVDVVITEPCKLETFQ